MIEKYRTLLKLISHARPGKGLLAAIGLFSILTALTSLVFPVVTQQLVDQLGDAQTLPTNWLLGLIAILVAGSFIGGLNFYLIGKVANRMLVNLRSKVLAKAIRLPVPYYDDTASADPASRIVNDTQIINELVSQHFEPLISGTLTLLASLVILWFLDWQLTAVLFATLLVSFLITVPIAARLANLSKSIQQEEATFLGFITERLAQIRLIKACTAESESLDTGQHTLSQLYQLGQKEVKIGAIMAPIASLSIVAALVSILVFGAARVSQGAITMGELIAFILYLFNIIIPLIQFTYFFVAFNKAAGAAERVQELFDETEEMIDGGKELTIEHYPLSFSQVSFSYDSGQEIFNKLSLDIDANSTVALVGSSGAGKTTIFSLLQRFYSPAAGEILIDGQSITNYPLSSWRQQLAYVSQDTPLLSGSIRENLLLGLNRNPSDESITQVLQLSQLSQFVEALNDGLDTQIGERGVKLSGGQKQRMAIARAMLQDRPILLCDEATSNLDSTTEHKIQLAMEQLKTNRTTLIAAHRLSTVLNADKIVVLKEGRVIAQGPHHQLMEDSAFYRELVEHQLNPFEQIQTVKLDESAIGDTL